MLLVLVWYLKWCIIESMEKDFDAWNLKKKEFDKNKRDLLFKEGEIWWCSLGVNIGEEVYGKGSSFRRPVIVFKKLSRNSCIVIPTSTQKREGSWYHYLRVQNIERWALMHQARFVSANRLYVRESALSDDDFSGLKKSVAKLLGL